MILSPSSVGTESGLSHFEAAQEASGRIAQLLPSGVGPGDFVPGGEQREGIPRSSVGMGETGAR